MSEDEIVREELTRVEDLLRSSGEVFRRIESDDTPAVPGAAQAWTYRAEGLAETRIYVCPDFESAGQALTALFSEIGEQDGDGLPAVGQNGRLVFVVHHLGGPGDRAAVYRTLGVVGALSGEEE